MFSCTIALARLTEERRLGPCHRRHGRHHPGDGESRRPFGVDIRLSTRVRRVLVENGRAVGVETDKGETIRAAPSPPGSIPSCSISTSSIPARRQSHFAGAWRLALRVGHVSHECRAFRTAGFHRPARRASAEHHAAGIIIGPSLAYMEQAFFDARTLGGRAARSSSWSSHRRSTIRWRRADSMSQACSASMSRRSCRTALHGTTIAKPSPIS